MTPSIIRIKDLWRSYRRGQETINACAGVNLDIEKGEMVSIVGRSGSGKTTLLNQIGCLDTPSRGELVIDGTDVTRLNESALVGFRRKKIGFVFQLFYLIPTLTVRENVELPLIFSRNQNRPLVDAILEKIGIRGIENMLPGQLDGGSMQKVALARALANRPEILLADEPTGRLEARAKDAILDLLYRLKEEGLTIVIATHDQALAAKTERIVRLSDGRVIEDECLLKEAR